VVVVLGWNCGLKVEGLRAAVAGAALVFSFWLNASRLEAKICHDFGMEIAFVYGVFGVLEGCGGLDTWVLGCFCEK
jgi:hypothetical protein